MQLSFAKEVGIEVSDEDARFQVMRAVGVSGIGERDRSNGCLPRRRLEHVTDGKADDTSERIFQ